MQETHPHRETRILPALAVLVLPVFFAALPGRYQLMPRGIPFATGLALAIPMLLAGFFPANRSFMRLERLTAAILIPLAACVSIALLALLFINMVKAHSEISGITLLTTSVAIWVNNIVIFALAYWQIDRGGPAGRSSGWHGRSDFTFPRGDPCDNFPDDWQPHFADYLALAFNTATAFSPTDVLPLRPRAKMLMMTESFISLVTVVAVGARAINILGSG
ncbi:MAG: hypothetical protein WB609_08975 [Candidatus Cybelea sp.]